MAKGLKKTEKELGKKENAKPYSLVTLDEMADMKVLKLKGYPTSRIAEMLGRNRSTVEKSLSMLEKVMPDSVDMQNKISELMEETLEQDAKNARFICQMSDAQVVNTMHEATAVEAAKIKQIYQPNLLRYFGMNKGEIVDDSVNSPKVQKFFTTIINIKQEQENDRSEATTRNKKSIGENVGRGEKNIIEGIVSK